MKNYLSPVLAVLCISIMAAPSPELVMKKSPGRSIVIDPAKKLQLTSGKQAMADIVVAPDAPPAVRFAASELAEYIKKSTGVTLPVAHAPTPGRTAVILGNNTWSRKAGLDIAKLALDGFFIRSADNAVYIAGNDDPKATPDTFGWGAFHQHGTLFGVYDFLERFLGVRFYFPGELGTIVPGHASLSVPSMNIVENPDFTRRRVGPGAEIAWFPENKFDNKALSRYYYQLRTESFYLPCCHSMERLHFVPRFGAKHPEIMAMDQQGKRHSAPGSVYYGNLCYSSKVLRDELYLDAAAYLTNKPPQSRGLKSWDPSCFQPGFFNIMPMDHFRDCHCPECKKFYANHPASELIWDLTADIARRLKKAGIPGYVTAMAYGHYPNPPSIALPDNILVMIQASGPWAENTPLKTVHDKRIDDWTRKLKRTPWSWSYVGKCGIPMPNVPSMTPRAIHRYFSRMRDRLTGSFMEAESDHWIFAYMNYYVAMKTLWDTSCNLEQLLQEHDRLMFGKGAVPMRRFFDRIEELWINRVTGRIVETALGPQAIQPSDMDVWENIYSPAEFKQFRAWFDEAARMAAGEPEAKKRIAYFRKYFLGRMEQGAARYFRTKAGVSALTYPAGTEEFLVPLKGDVAEVATRFVMTSTPGSLKLTVFCEEPAMDQLTANITRHDDPALWTDQVVEFFLNPSGDRKNYFHWIVNADGVCYDARSVRNGTESTHDPKWESKAQIKCVRQPGAWKLEMEIPLAQLGTVAEHFPFNITRFRVLRNKVQQRFYSFSPYINDFHDLENFGTFTTKASAATPDQVRNGRFVTPLKGGSYGDFHMLDGVPKPGANIYSLDKKSFRSAGQSLRIDARDGKPHGVTLFPGNLKPGTRYRLGYSIRLDHVKPDGTGYGGMGGFAVNYGVGDGKNNYHPHPWYTGTIPWTDQGLIFTTPAKPTHRTAFRFVIQHATGTVWLDNVSLREIAKDDAP